jgi:hypothetical protein
LLYRDSNFKISFKDKNITEDTIEVLIDDCEKNVKDEIKMFTELVHENEIKDIFNVLKNNILSMIKNAKIKNKIYENFMTSVEQNIGVKLNKYTFNYVRRNKMKVCVAFSKNIPVSDIQKTIESADHKFKNS